MKKVDPPFEYEKDRRLARPVLLASCSVRLFIVGFQSVLTDDDVLVRIVYQSAVFLAQEHELGWFKALNIREVNVNEDEDNEYPHAEVVDDTNRHRTAQQIDNPKAEIGVRCWWPQANTCNEHADDQNRDQQIGKLLWNA